MFQEERQKNMLEKYELEAQSSLKVMSNNGSVVYFDAFKLSNKNNNYADIIFITHPHFDHFSPEDILKIKKDK